MISTNKPSVGIVVRVFIGELPYIKAFFDYYIKIGASKFYVIISNVGDFEKIKSYLKDYEPYLNYKVNEKFILNNSFNLALPELKEDYILSVDVDEFLHVAPHETIQEYIAATGSADKYTFGWLLSVNDDISEEAPVTRITLPAKLNGFKKNNYLRLFNFNQVTYQHTR